MLSRDTFSRLAVGNMDRMISGGCAAGRVSIVRPALVQPSDIE